MSAQTFYIFSNAEIALMAYSRGFRKIVGFELPGNSSDEDDTIRTLNFLVNKGIYENTDNTFHMKEPFRSMITQMCRSQEIICVHYSDDNNSDLCCYPSDQILVCEQSSDCSRIKMNLCSIQELNERIISEVKTVKKGEHLYPEEQLISETDAFIENGKLSPNSTASLWVEKRNLVSGKRADLFLFEKALSSYLVCRRDGHAVMTGSSPGEITDSLIGLWEMEL